MIYFLYISMADKGRNKIMAKYLLATIEGFNGSHHHWSGVELHQGFCHYIRAHPVDSVHKYCIMFPDKTKSCLKHFLDKTIKFRKSKKHGKYWIKTSVEHDELVRTLHTLQGM
jgi:hypothetical protein